MDRRFPAERDAEVLPEQVAGKLLERASELDAVRGAGAAVGDLRAAATAAGISPLAFDAALAELHSADVSRETHGRRRRRSRPLLVLLAAVAALIGIGTIAVSRMLIPARVPVQLPMIEEAILLKCLSPGQAAALIRPHLRLPANLVVHRPDAPGVLTIRATPAQLREVQAVLEQHDGAGSPSCAVGKAAR